MNIIDAAINFLDYKKNNSVKIFPGDEESETEKEDKGKEKIEEQEKYYTRNNHILYSQTLLWGKDKFICFNTKLNKHPYQDDDIQPPQSC